MAKIALKLELRNHTAQKQISDPRTGLREPLLDTDGKPVPLFPQFHSIFLDGRDIGQCWKEPGHGVILTEHFDHDVAEAIKSWVGEQIGGATLVSYPPELQIEDDDEDGENE